MSIELVPLGTMTLSMAAPMVLPNTPAGTRVIIEFPHIRWEGDRLTAERKGVAAGDWLIIGPEGTVTLDIRICLETQDGAVIYVHGTGKTDSARFNAGAPAYIVPCFETGDARYAWLNRIQAVAKGTATGSTVVFEVYEVR